MARKSSVQNGEAMIMKEESDVERTEAEQSVDDTTEKGTQVTRIRQYKVAKTCSLVFVWMSFGMVHAVGSPTLPDLRDRFNTTMGDLALAFGFRNFGALLGSVLFSMMADRYRRRADLIMGLSIILTGATAIMVPNVGNLTLLGINSFIAGIGQGGLESVGTAMTQWMWGEKSDASFHALHMGYPIGSTIAPLIAMNFLGPEPVNACPIVNGSTTNTNSTIHCIIPANSTGPEQVSRIEIPYGVIGGITCLLGCIFLVMAYFGMPKGMTYYGSDKNSMVEVFSPRSCRAMGSTAYTCVLLVLICIFYVLLNAKDGSLSTFVFAFAVESQLKFTKHEAAILDTVYRSTEIVGRALSVPIAHFCPIQPMICVSVFLNATFTTCLALLGTKKKIYLWVFSCLFKFTAAPIWPSGMAWTSKYIKFSSMVVALTQIVLGVTGYFFDWFGGHLYDLSPSYFIYYGMVCALLLVVVMGSMQLTATCCASRVTNRGFSQVNTEDTTLDKDDSKTA